MLLLGVALAVPRLDPQLQPAEAVEAFRAFATSQGRVGDAAELVCRPFAEKVVLCFRTFDGGAQGWLTRPHELVATETAAKGTAEDALRCLEPTTVEGFARPYFVCATGNGREHAAVLFPDELKAKVGGDVVVAVPAHGVLLVWRPGDREFDKMVAVGVRRMYEDLADPVSPLVYRWDGRGWATWGTATVVAPLTGP